MRKYSGILKAFSLLIVSTMCFGTLRIALAKQVVPSDIYSGKCGASVNWQLDTSNGELTISGNGKMTDYNLSLINNQLVSTAPWLSFQNYISSVDIQNGVTSIGNYSFRGCTNLSSLSISNGVESIGRDAFSGCTSLSYVYIPESVTIIGMGGFSECVSLEHLKTGNCITSIGDGAFQQCVALIDVDLGIGVTSIGDYAFSDCSSLAAVSIPESVTWIGAYAFNGCSSLSSACIPNAVIGIGSHAFQDCVMLNSITIPDSVTSINKYAFYGCTALSSAFFTGDPPTSFGFSVFDHCANEFVIYYNRNHSIDWAPNGETTWHGYAIAPFSDSSIMYGDADGDGVVDTTDALLVLRCALDISGSEEKLLASCDMNGDGKIDTTDALLILRLALGIV